MSIKRGEHWQVINEIKHKFLGITLKITKIYFCPICHNRGENTTWINHWLLNFFTNNYVYSERPLLIQYRDLIWDKWWNWNLFGTRIYYRPALGYKTKHYRTWKDTVYKFLGKNFIKYEK